MKISLEFIMTSRIRTLCSGHYMHLIKSLGHHLNGCLLRCTGGCHRERSSTLKDHIMVIKDRWLL